MKDTSHLVSQEEDSKDQGREQTIEQIDNNFSHQPPSDDEGYETFFDTNLNDFPRMEVPISPNNDNNPLHSLN